MNDLKQIILEKYFSLRLRNKFLLPTLLVLFGSFLLFAIYIVRDQRRTFEAQLNEKARTLSFLIAHSNVENVWNYNEEALAISCRAFFKDKEIRAIKIRDTSGETLIDLSREISGSKEIVNEFNLIKDGQDLGRVRVVLSNFYIEENLAAIQGKFIAISLMIFAAIAVLISYVSSVALIPLNKLMDGVGRLTAGDLHTAIEIQSKDELGALARSFNKMLNELLAHRENLQGLVDQRTGELQEANEKLSGAMRQLWGEMELAKKIQTSLLPEDPALAGFEIAASLEPADKVGGDYYDIIHVGDYSWIVIGDVSGHGVPAGLIMMMVQTSIHTVLKDNPGLSTTQLLTTINKTIYSNIVKLGETKYMTLTVIAGLKNGKFSFSGLHQDILVYRAGTNRVEAIETYGMWLGIEYDISDMLVEENLELGIDDVMVLYTDGVTEARSVDGSMYEDDGLTRAIADHGAGSARELHNTIIQQLDSYKKPDDVTLVVIKRIR